MFDSTGKEELENFLSKTYPYHFWMRKIGKSFIKTSFCIFFFSFLEKEWVLERVYWEERNASVFYFKGEPENLMASSICFQTPILRNQKGILKREG